MIDFEKIAPMPDERFGIASSLFRQLQNVRRQWDLFVPPPPLNRSDMMMLGLVDHLYSHDEKDITVSQLARLTHQTLPAVSQKISSLESQGLIRRVTSKCDRRSARIEPTKKGVQMSQDAQNEFFGRLQRALELMGTDNVQQMLDLMGVFSNSLESVLKEAPGSHTAP